MFAISVAFIHLEFLQIFTEVGKETHLKIPIDKAINKRGGGGGSS